jgi:hypothetical protein
MNEEQIYIFDECVPFEEDDWKRLMQALHGHRKRIEELSMIPQEVLQTAMSDFMSVEQLQGLTRRRKLMHGEWLGPTPAQEREAEIAQQYHESCDAYDARVCTGVSPRSGEPMPISDHEQAASSRHAQEVRRHLTAEYGLTDTEFHRIITRHNRSRGDLSNAMASILPGPTPVLPPYEG